MAISEASFLHERDYHAVAISHFFIDILNSGRSLLVAVLAIALGLSNAQVGVALLIYNIGNALSQPLFGLLADRIGPRRIVVGGIGWMIIWFSLAAMATEWIALLAVTIAGLGSGAFHPSGTLVASQASQSRRTQATSIFFMSGQLGNFAGPILAGIVLQLLGRPGFLLLPLIALGAFASSWQWIDDNLQRQRCAADARQPVRSPQADHAAPAVAHRRTPSAVLNALSLSLIIVVTGTVSLTIMNFVPKLFTEMGLPEAQVGVLTGLLMLGSAIGGFFGGTLADRIGGRRVVALSMLASVLPIYFYIPIDGAARFFLLTAAGFFIGMSHSILILRAQALFPGRRAMASGLALGFMFFTGSLGSYGLGFLADVIGLATALQGMALLPFFAVVASFLLAER
jgi:FSR family fosmidomycin resistance protein-like MFS transporter